MNAHSLWILLLAGQATLSAGQADQQDPVIPTTTPPIVYTINYGDDYFKNPEYIDKFKAAPPDLLHIGKATPISHHWGPTRLYKGENQYTGGPGHTLSRENIALLSPEALDERIETIRQTLCRYHAIGIREITPYISYHTLAGDHEKREGFWKFYDRWATYAKWAGPQPPHDPFDWLVVDVNGKFVGGSCGGYSPDYFAPLHRYRACINHPDWAEWHRRLIRMIAEVGYDGCFVDNTHPDRCYCRYCKAAFRKFLDESRNTDWVRRMTEGLDIDKLQLDSPDVPAELVRRFRMLRTADHLGMLRKVGREVKPGFTIFPNGNSLPECLVTGSQCDRLMFESTYSPGILAADTVPERGDITIVVSPEACPPKRITHRYECVDRRKRIEMEADFSLPTRAKVGQTAELGVKVLTVGGSDRDNDVAEDFFILMREVEGGNEVRLELEPRIPLGAPGRSGKGKRPPAVLKTVWTPKRPGAYLVHFGFNYVDGPRHSHLARLTRGQLCRTHQAKMQFVQHMHARSIFLGYDASRSGRENVQELALAETAAFSGGGGFSARNKPQAKYRAFFKKHPELFDGYRQAAPAAILYARWGSNPFSHVRIYGQPTIHDHLGQTHRPYVALVDASLPEKSDALAVFRVIYLEAAEYELSAPQLAALRKYVEDGGCLVLADTTQTINGRPAAELFGVSHDRPTAKSGRGTVALWQWEKPLVPTAAVAPGDGRRGNLRFALYRKSDRLAMHVVNYNVCLLDKARRRVLDVEPTPLEIPVPADWTAAQATCFDPDAEPQAIDCTVADGTARFTLPKTHICKIVLLEKR